MAAPLPQSGSMDGTVMQPMVHIRPEDLTSLATQVAEGLSAQLTGTVQLGLERLLKEHEQWRLATLPPEALSASKNNQGRGSSNVDRKAQEGNKLSPRSTNSGQSHSRHERHWLKMPWGSDFPWAASSGVARLEEAMDSELLATVHPRADAGPRGISVPAHLTYTMDDETSEEDSTGEANRRCRVKAIHSDSLVSGRIASMGQAPGKATFYNVIASQRLKGNTDQNESAHSQRLKWFGKSTEEVIAAAVKSPPPPAELPASAGLAAELSGMVAQCHQESRQGNWPSMPEGKADSVCSHALAERQSAHTPSSSGNEIAVLPNEAAILPTERRNSLEADLLGKACWPEEAATKAAAAAVAVEHEPGRGPGSGHTPSKISQASAQCWEAKSDGAVDMVATASDATTSVLSPPSAAAARPSLQRSERGWSAVRSRFAPGGGGEAVRANNRRRTLSPRMFTSEPSNTKVVLLEREEELLGEYAWPCTPRWQNFEVRQRSFSNSTVVDSRTVTPESRDAKAFWQKREDELLSENGLPRPHQQLHSEILMRLAAHERDREAKLTGSGRSLNSKAFGSESASMGSERLGDHSEGILPSTEELFAASAGPFPPNIPEEIQSYHTFWPCTEHGAGSPLILRLCGILPWGRFGEAYRIGVLALAAGLVAIFVLQFVQKQSRLASPTACPMGVCLSFGYLSDLLLAMGSMLGLLAMRKLTTLDVLGSPTALLVRFAVEHNLVTKWSSCSSWQSLYLAVLWAASLAFRAATIEPDPNLLEVLRACAFVVSTLIYLALVFSILHVSCLICNLLDTYAQSIRRSRDLARSMIEWDRLVALLRRVSRAVDRGFLLVQITAVAILLCSFSDLLLQGDQQIWWLISNVLLTQSLVLLFSKAAEVTGYCTRLPAVINSFEFDGDIFSFERHYLVEHITYSDAGFYVGDIRLTAGMALKLVHISILAAFGVLSKLTLA